ncbi:hypothetical protein GGE12_004468 [Rhizobium mongolense]|uniref:Transposase IS166 family protein n=1 Tax=Rhizobium mongolense TaxID=57676 RepID=A0A7W6RQ88_9HYPH|nr:hypothetical protein [Rhizobium mongolense]
MTPAGTPTVAELMALLAANAAENAALKAERDALAQRVFKLEEELALAQLHRFAPRSEKHMDRVFNEAEKAALEADTNEGLADKTRPTPPNFPTRECPRWKSPKAASADVNLFRQICHANASNMTLSTIRRPVRAAAIRCIA